MQKFFDTFSKYINASDSIILAVSGGVDSMVLLDIIMKKHPKEKIVVAHFDHSLRGDESDGDRDIVANICNKEDIVFEMEKMDIGSMAKTENMNLEALARRERYQFLEKVRERHGSKYILTAHHSGDQTETIIGNMIKGGKVRGLSGMALISGNIFRPLLGIIKKEIFEYAKENTVEYREDSTNTDTTYDRNRIRHDIIPVLESMNPSIHMTIHELTLYMQELSGFLVTHIEYWLGVAEGESGKSDTFLITSFLVLSPFFQSEIISYLYARAHEGSTQGLSRGLIDELIRFISDKGSYGKKEIKNLRMERRGERIFIV